MKFSMDIPEALQTLKPYLPGKPIEETQREFGLARVVKLASNENPLGPNKNVLKAMEAVLPTLHRYPDPGCFELRRKASEYFGCPEEWITFGNGSDEMISFLIRIFSQPGVGRGLLTSKYSFVAYRIMGLSSLVEVREVPMTQDFRIDMDQMIRESTRGSGRIIFLANPNNPTGTYLRHDEVERLLEVLKNQNVMVVLDEAYFEYVRALDFPRSLELLRRFPHLVILRTMSKAFGLAGLRLGVLLGRPEVVELVNRVRPPFNVNSMVQVAAVAALSDAEFLSRTQHITWAGLDYLSQELKKLGLRSLPSQANFLLVDFGYPADQIYNELLKIGLILRPVANYGLTNHLRISVGLEDENQMVIDALKSIFRKKSSLSSSVPSSRSDAGYSPELL